MNRKSLIKTVGCLAIAVSATAQAAVKTINPSADTTIFQNNVNNSYGGGSLVFAGTNSAVSPRRGIIEFDIADNIPPGATITSVQLNMVLGQVAGSGMGSGGGTPTIGLYDVSESWGEGTQSTGSGQGGPAETGDATWNDRFFSATSPTAWTTAGGDFSGSASQTAAVGTSVGTTYSWTTDTAMVADVQTWLDSPSKNFGWFMVNSDETDEQTFRAFDTRETSSPEQLVINYTAVPEPTMFFSAACLISLLRRRRVK
jgi:hypothetical protein